MKLDVNTRGVVSRLAKYINRTEDLRPALKLAGLYMMKSIDENFRAEGRPAKWKKLARSTIEARREGPGRGRPMVLQDTGVLRASVTAPGGKGKGAGLGIWKLSKAQLIIGTRVEYAAKHQEGKGVDARPFLLFQREDTKAIQAIFLNYVMKGK